ncbi:hypothetical protein RND71_020762 [Anisodus tanguticus]|uniref:FAD/NAD(P)-binding domain-containing protein n=1 Tax=Anisodus tanguticus TaxID=243964 RepID=A0AAE1RWZ1_9SOLA|nr:hypothetical protein RND71_020762 [Anisodus tanguticus]
MVSIKRDMAWDKDSTLGGEMRPPIFDELNTSVSHVGDLVSSHMHDLRILSFVLKQIKTLTKDNSTSKVVIRWIRRASASVRCNRKRKDYFEIPWASLKAKVEPLFAERSLIHHKDYLANGRLVVSEVTNINHKEVLTADSHQFAYDYLVVAIGHYDPLPVTRNDRMEEYQTQNEKIKAVDSILMVGGGPTGVELAAEIAVDFPKKKVTLVHNRSRLLEFIGSKTSDKTLE